MHARLSDYTYLRPSTSRRTHDNGCRAGKRRASEAEPASQTDKWR